MRNARRHAKNVPRTICCANVSHDLHAGDSATLHKRSSQQRLYKGVIQPIATLQRRRLGGVRRKGVWGLEEGYEEREEAREERPQDHLLRERVAGSARRGHATR
jgi:hypothetical protein